MITFDVKTAQPYPIVITDGWQDFSCYGFGKKVCVVSDTNVAPLYLDTFCKNITDREVVSYVIEAGEQSKNATNYLAILSYLAQNGFTRKDTVVALGGGVVGDLAGFVAATYMRGIGFYQVPTTLLAMIDSSVGGKTAIDLPDGKNYVGAFYQPFGVYINMATLNTLPKSEFDNGKGELVKYAFLSTSVKQSDLKNITPEVVHECLKIKAQIVEEDEKDSGKRMLLNLGHTVGHAIETLSQYTIPHGLCVAKGLDAIIDISQKYYNLDEVTVCKMKNLLTSAQLDTVNPYGKQVAEKISKDKKAGHEFVNFVLLTDVGNAHIEKISIKDIEKLI